MEFNVVTELVGDIYSATIKMQSGIMKDDKFYFYLLRDDRVIFRLESWISQPKYHWDLTESGVYTVQAHVKRNSKNTLRKSIPTLYLQEEKNDEFSRWLTKYSCNTETIPKLELYKPQEPYQRFCVVSCADGVVNLPSIDLDLHATRYHSCNSIVFSDKELKIDSLYESAFSGSFVSEKTYYFGQDELPSSEILIKNNQIGSYSNVTIEKRKKQLIISTDYFGVNKIFYFRRDGIFVASNNYHLLIVILSKLGVNLSLDKGKAISKLVFISLQPFHQNYSSEMDIQDIFVLSVDKKIVIRNGLVTFVDSEIAKDINNPPSYDSVNYLKLLEDAKGEIIGNLDAVLNHSRFNTAILDLSGGMDSRIVYAAATNLPQHKEKIKINSHYVAAEPKDLTVALSLNSFYNYEFDDLPRYRECIPRELLWSDSWSYNLGNYYSYVPLSFKNKIKDAIRLVGFYGEICARPYYARQYLQDNQYDVAEVDTFVERYFTKHQGMSFLHGDDTLLQLKKLFQSELEHLPGRSPLEKFDNHYLYFRNGLHCSDIQRSDYSCPEWGPIMSKSLFKAKTMAYQEFKNIKVQLDILHLMNPVLASHPYQSDKDNDDKVALMQENVLHIENSIYENLIVRGNDNDDLWSTANRKKSIVNCTPADEIECFNQEYRNTDSTRDRLFFSMLAYLYQNEFIGDAVAKSLWYFYSTYSIQTSARPMIWNLANRIASIYYQAAITKKNET